jgi:hypothetical protein
MIVYQDLKIHASVLATPMETKAGIRHVRTAGGKDHFGQEIGEVIVSDALKAKLHALNGEGATGHPEVDGTYVFSDKKGNKWDLYKHDDGLWYTMTHQPDPDKWGVETPKGGSKVDHLALLRLEDVLQKRYGITPPPRKRTVKKPVAKKAVAKKVPAKKAPAKKPVAKKPAAKKSTTSSTSSKAPSVATLMKNPTTVQKVRDQLKTLMAETVKDARLAKPPQKNRVAWQKTSAHRYDPAIDDPALRALGIATPPPMGTDVWVANDLVNDDLSYRYRGPITHVIKVSGVTLNALAGKYKCTVARLKADNPHLKDQLPGSVLPGETAIRVPYVDPKGNPIKQKDFTPVPNPKDVFKNTAILHRRVAALEKLRPKLDAAAAKDSIGRGKQRDAAAVVLLMSKLGMRVSSDTVVDGKPSYGASTLQAQHVRQSGNTTYFDFIGKEQVHIKFKTNDPQVFAMIANRLKTKSGKERLFFTNKNETKKYIKDVIGTIPGDPSKGEFDNKDLRTLKAHELAKAAIAKADSTDAMTVLDANGEPDKKDFDARRMKIAIVVSAQLGNKPTQALSSYIDPLLFLPWNPEPSWIIDSKLLQRLANA